MTSPARAVATPALGARPAPRPAPAPRPGTGALSLDVGRAHAPRPVVAAPRTAVTVPRTGSTRTDAPTSAVRLPAGRRPTLAGAIVLSAVVTLAGALADLVGDHQLGGVFAGGFVLACLLGAATVRASRLRAVLVAPPLVYCAAVALTAPLNGAAAGGLATRVLGSALNAVVLHAPVLWAGTLLSAAVVLVRARRARGRR